MKNSKEELQIMKDFFANLTVDQTKEFVRRATGPIHRELTGDEYDHVWTMLQLIEPASASDNQHFWTDVYIIGNQENYKEYHVTYSANQDLPTIEVIGE